MAVGDLLITQDQDGSRPAKVISLTTHSVTEATAVTTPSENGVVAADGTILLSDKSSGGTNALYIYDASLALVTTVTTETISQFAGGQGNVPVAYDGTYFYCAQDQSGTVHVAKMTLAGVVVDTWTFSLPAGWLRVLAIAVSRDSSTLFYSGILISGSGGVPIKRYDLNGSAPLTDFYTPAGTDYIVDLYVLSDQTLLFGQTDYAGTGSVKRYSMAGVLQTTNTLSDPFGGSSTGTWFPDHVAPADDPTSYWVWIQQTNGGDSSGRDYVFTRYLSSSSTSDHTIDDVLDQYFDDSGGVPDSCPIIALGAASIPVDLSEPCCPCDCPKPPVPSRAPLASHPGPILPVINPAGWEANCAGGGTVPTASDATDAESWVS
jgi:hypothetical protein